MMELDTEQTALWGIVEWRAIAHKLNHELMALRAAPEHDTPAGQGAAQLDWKIVHRALEDARKTMEAGGVRHSWMDAPCDIAKQYAAQPAHGERQAVKVIVAELARLRAIPDYAGNIILEACDATLTEVLIAIEALATPAKQPEGGECQPGEIMEAWMFAYTSLGADEETAAVMICNEIEAYRQALPAAAVQEGKS